MQWTTLCVYPLIIPKQFNNLKYGLFATSRHPPASYSAVLSASSTQQWMRGMWKKEGCERKHTEHCVCLNALKKVLLEQKECWIVLGHSHSLEKRFRERGSATQIFSRVFELSPWLKIVRDGRGKALWPHAWMWRLKVLLHCWGRKIWKEMSRKKGWKEGQIICLLYERGKTFRTFSGVCWMRCHSMAQGNSLALWAVLWPLGDPGHWCSLCCSHPTQEAEFSFPILICATADSSICPSRSCSYEKYIPFLKLLPPPIA